MKSITTSLILSVLLLCSSCKKWIDVKPSDRLAEDVLFSNKEGFLKALNGVYIELANNDLYGQNLTTSSIDAMAGYYYIVSSTHQYNDFATYSYTGSNGKAGIEAIWKKAYELIANCNIIIEKAGTQNKLLPAPYYNIIKGEAIGLRAMLHLDLLRLFGPIWSDDARTKQTIPYKVSSEIKVDSLLSADQVMNNIINDLSTAKALLKDADPILTDGVRNNSNPAGSNDLYYRQYRLNYFAVSTLMARAYLWKGDKTNAAAQAKQALSETQKSSGSIFPFVSYGAATSVDKPDRMFSSEVIFSLYTINRLNMYNNLFAASQQDYLRLGVNAGNTDKAKINEIYNDENDYRLRIWENVVADGKTILTNQKFKDYTDAPGRYMLPLIRLSELYLIAAETANTIAEGTDYLNKVRTSRNCVNLSPATTTDLKNIITAEYRREFLGEGQMFFYYKRNAIQSIPNNAAVAGYKTMPLANYVVPLPDSEISQRIKK